MSNSAEPRPQAADRSADVAVLQLARKASSHTFASPAVEKWIGDAQEFKVYDHGAIFIANNQVARVLVGNPSENKITWSEARFRVLDQMITDLEQAIAKRQVRAIVFASPAKDAFIFGADLSEVLLKHTVEEFKEATDHGHRIFGRVRALPVKKVVAIRGACVGGGLEFALNCDEIVACKTKGPSSGLFESEKTKLALPEVMLGIFPGWGGTILLPAKIGLQAIDLILTGKDVYPDQAHHIGLVDRLAPPDQLFEVAENAALSSRKPWNLQGIQWSGKGVIRDIKNYAFNEWTARYGYRMPLVDKAAKKAMGGSIISQAAAIAQKGIQSFDPTAQLGNARTALQVILFGLKNGIEPGLAYEREQVVKFIASERTKGMVRFHFAQTAVGEAARGVAIALPEKNVAIVGAGVMGGGIAASFASKGAKVTLSDNRVEALDAAKKRVLGLIDKNEKRGSSTAAEAAVCKQGFAIQHERIDYSNADLLIEAISENLELKKRVLPSLEATLKPDAIMATNTSSKPVGELATVLKRPENFCGIHFFNPAETMKLVEVVRGEKSSQQTIDRAKAFVRAIGKTPVVVSDGAGFLVNRVLSRYMAESQHLLSEGYYPKDIDMAGKHAGFMMGPLDTLDLVGLDVAAEVLETMIAAYGERMTCPIFAKALLDAGHKGQKTGKGFHSYPSGAKSGVPISDPKVLASLFTNGLSSLHAYPDLDTIAKRLRLPLIDETVRCLDEGVAGEPGKFAAQQIDVGLVLGSGSLAVYGGPLSYAESLGAAQIVSELEALHQSTGAERFKPCQNLVERARRGISFYQAL
jgi:3-hydroxyacyl-CoA dehydrogenase/enoyl-CoA hydratase/3-hydroxybutyryl-CoA epimerase